MQLCIITGVPLLFTLQPAQKVRVIALVAENSPALDAVHDHMLQGPRRVYSGSTGHALMLRGNHRFWQIIKYRMSPNTDAGVPVEAVDYINAHGTFTPANDLMETRAIKTVFGRRADQVPISSTKSMIGHTLGAAGAIEGVASLLAIHHRFIPPTIHHRTSDPQCDLDFVAEGARSADLNVVLSNSFAFGGSNPAVVFGKFTDPGGAHA